MKKYLFLFVAMVSGLTSQVRAIDIVDIQDDLKEFVFEGSYIEYVIDPSKALTIDEICSYRHNHKFRPISQSTTSEISTSNLNELDCWVRIKINHHRGVNKRFLLEFPQSFLDQVTYYMPQGKGRYEEGILGDQLKFEQRKMDHKNFELFIPEYLDGPHYYYFQLKYTLLKDFTIYLRSLEQFVGYSLKEYLLLGLFYGMILIVCLYNLLMFIALNERQFLFYVLYLVCFGLYFMAENGTGFQYLWPNSPGLNGESNALFLYGAVLWAMLFAREFLNTKSQFPLMDKILLGTIAFRTLFFLVSIFVSELSYFKIIDVIPLAVGLGVGVVSWRNGIRPARFFVLSYCCLLLGCIITVLGHLGVIAQNSMLVVHAMNWALCFDMLFITFAFTSKVAMIRNDKDRAHKKIVQSLEKNQKLKDKVNRELEEQVALRTIEVNENNRLLSEANIKLKQQAEEINRMNLMLDMDNRNLKKDIKKTLAARIMKPNVSIQEFQEVFPDSIACYKFLFMRKQERGFECMKCANDKFSEGVKKYSRRCTKCGYNESVTANTIFHGVRFPIEKAFCIFYLTIERRDEMTIDQMSEIVDLRRNTCWAFKKKVVKALEDKGVTDIKELSESWDVIFVGDKN